MEKDKDHKCIDLDDLLVQTRDNIEKFGLQVILVGATDYLPSFAYSIGLYKTYGCPEIICFGLPNETIHAVINDIADLIKNGEKIEPAKNYYNIFKDSKAEFLVVDERNIQDYFGVAINFYESTKFPTLQLVWTDRNDKFPWEENFEEKFLRDQPLLDRNAEFKFRESDNLGVFTTRQWLDLSKPILKVVHDFDGDWQFLTGEQMPEDIRLVALHQMIFKDKTLNDVFDLDYGEAADREFIGDKWKRKKVEVNEDE